MSYGFWAYWGIGAFGTIHLLGRYRRDRGLSKLISKWLHYQAHAIVGRTKVDGVIMRDRPDRIACAVATTNGFAMPIRSSHATACADQNKKGALSEAVRLVSGSFPENQERRQE